MGNTLVFLFAAFTSASVLNEHYVVCMVPDLHLSVSTVTADQIIGYIRLYVVIQVAEVLRYTLSLMLIPSQRQESCQVQQVPVHSHRL